MNIKTAGTVFKSIVTFPDNVQIFRTDDPDFSIDEIIDTFNPTAIINFLRGEDALGFKLHNKIIDLSIKKSIHYIYASSALALDGYNETDLTESLLARSISPYGVFKATCEQKLYDSNIDWTILRFASVQGWVPHKKTRNQLFLEKMSSHQEVMVDRGIWQNRILASVLVEGIIDIIEHKIKGIVHFGAQDASEEYTFLKEQAQMFGFNKDLVLSGPFKNVNLVTKPDKMIKLFGNKYKVTEKETLIGLTKITELENIKILKNNDCKN